jgi:hypothetical protein
MRLLSLLLCIFMLGACKSTRTVVAGPQNVEAGRSDYSPEKEEQTRAAGAAAASGGVVGQFGSGGDTFNKRFGSFDPGGYIQTKQDPRDPKKSVTVYGLNHMSEKNFGGNLNSKDMKSFTQTRDFLTRRYAGTRELYQKGSSAQGVKSWFANRKANVDRQASESGTEFSGNSRMVATKTSSSDGRTVNTRDARESGRTVQTRDFYPAKKVLDRGGDAPKIIGEGDKETNASVWRLIKSRPRDNPATVEEIRALLGKTN